MRGAVCVLGGQLKMSRLLLQCYQGLDVLFLFVCCSPYGDVADEVGVRMHEVEAL